MEIFLRLLRHSLLLEEGRITHMMPKLESQSMNMKGKDSIGRIADSRPGYIRPWGCRDSPIQEKEGEMCGFASERSGKLFGKLGEPLSLFLLFGMFL